MSLGIVSATVVALLSTQLNEAGEEVRRRADREAALLRPMRDKWRFLAIEQARQEADPDYRAYFLASQEAHRCSCVRPNPAELAAKLAGSAQGEPEIASFDAQNTTCVVCFLDAFDRWKARATQTCQRMEGWSENELSRFELSDDGPSIPRQCFQASREARLRLQRFNQQLSTDGVSTPTASALGRADAGTSDAQISGSWVTINGYTYYRPPSKAGAGASAGKVGADELPSANNPAFVPPPKPEDPGPPPLPPASNTQREDGRLYVRLNMSSVCSAELRPGPIQVRNGDLILVP